MILEGLRVKLFSWKRKKTSSLQHIEDFMIGKKVEISVFRLNHMPKPAESFSIKRDDISSKKLQ
jgi:hypothetical protein